MKKQLIKLRDVLLRTLKIKSNSNPGYCDICGITVDDYAAHMAEYHW